MTGIISFYLTLPGNKIEHFVSGEASFDIYLESREHVLVLY